jgi:predicted NBD/HSP70 family sugar kinase
MRAVLYPFAPQVVVLGGGISQSSPLFLSATLAELQGLDVELRISQLRDHAALVGAGVRWFETHSGNELAIPAKEQLQADPV